MSLEQAIGGLEDAITKLTTLVSEGNELCRQAIALYPRPGTTPAAETETPATTETKPAAAKARPSRAKTAPVTPPPVETATDDDGFGEETDDGFGDDEPAGEFVKNYTAEDAKNCLKALRDGLKVTKPFTEDQARDTAKKAMLEAGFAKLDAITDDAANAVVAIAVKYANAAGVEAEKSFKTRAAQYGTEIA